MPASLQLGGQGARRRTVSFVPQMELRRRDDHHWTTLGKTVDTPAIPTDTDKLHASAILLRHDSSLSFDSQSFRLVLHKLLEPIKLYSLYSRKFFGASQTLKVSNLRSNGKQVRPRLNEIDFRSAHSVLSLLTIDTKSPEVTPIGPGSPQDFTQVVFAQQRMEPERS